MLFFHRAEREQVLQHYRALWKDYEAKYQSFPLAQELQRKNQEVAACEEKVKQNVAKLSELRTAVSLFSGPGLCCS